MYQRDFLNIKLEYKNFNLVSWYFKKKKKWPVKASVLSPSKPLFPIKRKPNSSNLPDVKQDLTRIWNANIGLAWVWLCWRGHLFWSAVYELCIHCYWQKKNKYTKLFLFSKIIPLSCFLTIEWLLSRYETLWMKINKNHFEVVYLAFVVSRPPLKASKPLVSGGIGYSHLLSNLILNTIDGYTPAHTRYSSAIDGYCILSGLCEAKWNQSKYITCI